MLLLGDMHVDAVEGYSSLQNSDGKSRLFRRKLLQVDKGDEVKLPRLDRCLVTQNIPKKN